MLKDSELDTQRGGQSLVITNQTMDSIVAGSVLNGDYTAGSVALSDFALSNFNGVGNLLINTGAQVSAQSAMNLTINLGDGFRRAGHASLQWGDAIGRASCRDRVRT